MRRERRESGFSLLELLVAMACTAMLSAAVFALLVGSAGAVRRDWGDAAALRSASAAAVLVAADLRAARQGLELADALRQDGVTIPVMSSTLDRLQVVVARPPAAEVRSESGARYVVDAAAAIGRGDLVAALGSVGRPLLQPLPVGTVVDTARVADGIELRVTWRSPEATDLAAWGPPRALLPVSVRSYAPRVVGGLVRLDRRTNAGPRQPVADGLASVQWVWMLDTDADGRADTESESFMPTTGLRACSIRIEVTAAASTARALEPGRAAAAAGAAGAGGTAAVARPPLVVTRWLNVDDCR